MGVFLPLTGSIGVLGLTSPWLRYGGVEDSSGRARARASPHLMGLMDAVRSDVRAGQARGRDGSPGAERVADDVHAAVLVDPRVHHETSIAMRRCLLPAILAMTAFGVGLACDFFGGIVKDARDRRPARRRDRDRVPARAGRVGGDHDPRGRRGLVDVRGSRRAQDPRGARGAEGARRRGDARAGGAAGGRADAGRSDCSGRSRCSSRGCRRTWRCRSRFIPRSSRRRRSSTTFKAFVSPLDLINFVVKLTVAGFLVGVVSLLQGDPSRVGPRASAGR